MTKILFDKIIECLDKELIQRIESEMFYMVNDTMKRVFELNKNSEKVVIEIGELPIRIHLKIEAIDEGYEEEKPDTEVFKFT